MFRPLFSFQRVAVLLILGFSNRQRVGRVARRPMKHDRHFVADCAVRPHLIVVSTPSLTFSPCLVEVHEPVDVQAVGAELPIQAR